MIARLAAIVLLVLALGAVGNAAHCPDDDPNRSDCKAAAKTAENPLIAIIGAIIGAILGIFASPVYAEEPSPSPRAVKGPRFKTDKGRDVETVPDMMETQSDLPSDEIEKTAIRNWGLTGRLKRLGPNTDSFNCHGFTFCDSKGAVMDPEAVERILADNGYSIVTQGVRAGDVAVYRAMQENGKIGITHTGVVVRIEEGLIVIHSKFGRLGTFEHGPEDVKPDWGKKPDFYRTTRPGGNTLKAAEP